MHVDYQTGLKRDKMIKLLFNNQRTTKMAQQLILVVVVILCIVSKTPRAFVAAEELDVESTIPEFGECFSKKLYK